MATSIWGATGVTPAATDRIPVDVSSSGAASRWTGQQIADAAGFIGRTHNALGSISTATAINLANGTYVSATIAGPLEFTITNAPASPNGCEFTFVLTDGGSATITWPGSVTWASGTAPTLTASGVNVLHFATGNGGTNWYGWTEADEVYSPGGSSGQPQYNAAGAFAGMAGVAWDDTNRSETRTGATVTTSNPVQSLTQTWNSSGVTFTGWRLNITSTASASGSLIADVQLGGVSCFSVTKTGAVAVGMVNGDDSGSGYYVSILRAAGSNYLELQSTGKRIAAGGDNGGLGMVSGAVIGWSSNSTIPPHQIASQSDAGIARNAAGVVEVNSGTAGTLRDIKVRNLLAGGGNGSYVQTPSMAVADLASAATAGSGARAFVTDATATTFLSTVSGGGSNKVPVVSDGTNWLIG